METAVVNEVNEVEPTYELTALDRCDAPSCSAQAYVITKHTAGPLLWCRHHFAKREMKLLEFVVKDDRHLLLADNRGAGAEAH